MEAAVAGAAGTAGTADWGTLGTVNSEAIGTANSGAVGTADEGTVSTANSETVGITNSEIAITDAEIWKSGSSRKAGNTNTIQKSEPGITGTSGTKHLAAGDAEAEGSDDVIAGSWGAKQEFQEQRVQQQETLQLATQEAWNRTTQEPLHSDTLEWVKQGSVIELTKIGGSFWSCTERSDRAWALPSFACLTSAVAFSILCPRCLKKSPKLFWLEKKFFLVSQRVWKSFSPWWVHVGQTIM